MAYKRNFPDWLKAFCDYAGYGEAPRKMYFWTGAATVAGALRRRVWIDQRYFQWYCNLYVILVAPPGIVSKTTTADTGMKLLRRVPGIHFGPSVITWQALVTEFAAGAEGFDYQGEIHPMSALTISSGEFGNLVSPRDTEMVDMLVNLWDGKPFRKVTKSSGNDEVVNPWINLIACTTPDWIAGNFPEYMIGGGFTSRCVFVYCDAKDKYVAYPGSQVPKDMKEVEDALVEDLVNISEICGEYVLTPEAIEWGTAWYEKHYKHDAKNIDSTRFGGYIARKQTHIHKLAMILAAATRDDLVILPEDLATADAMVTDLEAEMYKVFSKIGSTGEALHAQRLLEYIKKQQKIPYEGAIRFLQAHFPGVREIENTIAALIKGGMISLEQAAGGKLYLVWVQGTI